MKLFFPALMLCCLPALSLNAVALDAASTAERPVVHDSALAQRLGADQRGMRHYVLAILKTGPKRMPDGEQRDAMFSGHFANIQRLADEGKLALAGPFEDNPDGWRGLFLFAVADIDEARRLAATDPVIVNGEMIAEYHDWYGSAAVMMIPEIHKTIAAPTPTQ